VNDNDDPVNNSNERTYLHVAIGDDAIEANCPSQSGYAMLYKK
jgi:hypothetical protein